MSRQHIPKDTHTDNLSGIVRVFLNSNLSIILIIAAALLGILCLALFYRWTGRLYGRSTALLMVGLIAFQPNFLFFSVGRAINIRISILL